MSSRTTRLIAVILALSAACARAEDWNAFVVASDHGDDGVILELLRESDFQTQIGICESIGLRSDPDASALLSWLLSRFSATGEYRTDYLLRVAMRSLFDPSRGDEALRARLAANAGVVDDMVKHIGRFEDPQLKAIIISLPGPDAPDRRRALMEIGAEIADRLRRTDGHLSPPERGLALDYLAVTREIGDRDFLEPCIAIARLSRDQDLVRGARQASKLVADRAR